MSDELWRWTADALAVGIRTGAISSREATESCLARLEAVNPRINAVVDILADEALATADKADAAVRRGAGLGVLHGVPVTVKINVDYAGRPTTNGVKAFADSNAQEDSISVANRVTVLLPFEPVTAITGIEFTRANNSTSPTRSSPTPRSTSPTSSDVTSVAPSVVSPAPT